MSEENDKPSLKSRLHIPAWLNIPFIIIIVGAVMILFVQQNNIFTIYENMHITRLNSASEEQLSILNECASLYGKNSFKKIIRQFLMTGNARLLPRLSLEKANALRDLKKSISLDFLANFTPSI